MLLQKGNVLFLLIVFISSFANILDAWDDMSHHTVDFHITMNISLGVLSLLGMLLLFRQFLERGREIQYLKHEVKTVRHTLGQQQATAGKLMGELSALIHQQFSAWQLSDAEKEVALLLLKGLSLEEIAAVRGRAEKTVRQQASSIYNKAGLGGRHALSAYFFEDLLGKK